jgi:hypothetical protein
MTEPTATAIEPVADRWLAHRIVRGDHNLERLKQDPAAFGDAVLSAVPTTFFVLVRSARRC